MTDFSWLPKRLRFLLIGFCCFALCVACSSTPTETTTNPTSPTSTAKILKVATEPAFPPFESKSPTGDGLVGFDIDLFNEIGKAAKFEVKFESLPFDGIIPALQAGTVDAAISGMTITPERQKTVSFSRPYFKSGLAIAAREESKDITGLESLKDKKIAVQIGTTGADKAKGVPGSKISTFDSAPLALQELSNKNVDAVINDAPVTLYALKSGNLKNIKVVGQLLTEEYYGIAIPKNSPNIELVNQGLTTIIENGTYNTLYEKWFTGKPPELPKS